MTDQRAAKLAKAGVDLTDATILVNAGLDTPAKIKKASDKEIEMVLGFAGRSALRAFWPIKKDKAKPEPVAKAKAKAKPKES